MICHSSKVHQLCAVPQQHLSCAGPISQLQCRSLHTAQLHSRVTRPVLTQRSRRASRGCTLCVRAQGGVGGFFGGSREVFVAGAAGQLGVRVVLQLLDAGIKVAAGVPDLGEAQTLLGFAKTYELIKKDNQSKLRLAEVDLSSESSLASEISKGGTVLAVVGDAAVGKKGDARLASRALAAAKEAGAGRFVLLTPQGGAASGGGLFGFFNFGGGGGSGGRSSLEQEVISSGLSYVILRHAKNDFASGQPGGGESANLQLGPEGSLPSGARYQPLQVAAAAAVALQQASGDVILEAWSDPSASLTPTAELLQSVLQSASVEADEAGESEQEQEPSAMQDQEDEAPKPKRRGGLFGGGSKPQESDEDEAEDEPEKKPAGGFFGTLSSRGKQESPAEDSPPPRRGGGLGGLLNAGKKEVQQVTPDGNSARKAAAQASKAKTAVAKQAGRTAGDRPGEATEDEGANWLSFLGINQKTSFADDNQE